MSIQVGPVPDAFGVDIYRRDLNSFNFNGETRNTTYQQATTGLQLRAGVPLTEYCVRSLPPVIDSW